MRSTSWLVAALLATTVACSSDDNNGHPGDAPFGTDGRTGDGGAGDAGSGSGDFTAFVIDQVTNDTTLTATPVAFATFSTLPDPDGSDNNTAAYASLF